jgi:hypothetical protein
MDPKYNWYESVQWIAVIQDKCGASIKKTAVIRRFPEEEGSYWLAQRVTAALRLALFSALTRP